MTEIIAVDGWLEDANGNKSSVEYFGSESEARKALASLENCNDCINCSRCSRCSYCSDCSRCSYCSDCSDCSHCSDCSDCSHCSDCLRCSRCSRCSYCSDCSRCSRCSCCSCCSRCSDCSDCSHCSDCLRCSRCSYCSDSSDCSYCSDCSRCSCKIGTTGVETVVIPIIPKIHSVVYAAASQAGALDMRDVHQCKTTHCRAGWVVTLAGDGGQKLEQRFNWELAAMMIYRESGYDINPCRFYDDNASALEDMKRLADAEAQEVEASA